MTKENHGTSADLSAYFHESANADLATLDTSAGLGNLADFMSNSVVIVQTWRPAGEIMAPKTTDTEFA